MSESVDLKKVESLYQTLRKAEWQNDHTGEFDDKHLISRFCVAMYPEEAAGGRFCR